MTTTTCSNCGQIVLISEEICPRCGSDLTPVVNPVEADQPQPIRYPSEPYSRFHQEGAPAFHGVRVEPLTGAGTVIGPALSLFIGNIWFITKLVFVVFAPLEIFKVLQFGQQQNSWQAAAGVGLLTLVGNALIAPSLTYGIFTKMRTGVTPGLNECYRWGLGKLLTLTVSTFISMVLVFFGMIALIVPGIILILGFELIYPIATLENLGPVETLKRSWHLTKGHKGTIFLALFCMALIASLVQLPVGGISVAMAFNAIHFWPLDVVLAMLVDIANQITTVLSLVIYLSILQTLPGQQGLGVE
jgi:uncharacterized membrane protein